MFSEVPGETGRMIERRADITTPDGVMTTFVYHPEHDGPIPVVLYLMDAPSIRPCPQGHGDPASPRPATT